MDLTGILCPFEIYKLLFTGKPRTIFFHGNLFLILGDPMLAGTTPAPTGSRNCLK